MSTQLVALRNTVSKQVHEYPEPKARKILAHPIWGKANEEVRVAKPEVLSEPHTIGEDGERKPIIEGSKTEAINESTVKPSDPKKEKN